VFNLPTFSLNVQFLKCSTSGTAADKHATRIKDLILKNQSQLRRTYYKG
jgi:hypothetical protein